MASLLIGKNNTKVSATRQPSLDAKQYCKGIRDIYPMSTTFMAHAPNGSIAAHLSDVYLAFNTYCHVVMPQWYCSAYATIRDVVATMFRHM